MNILKSILVVGMILAISAGMSLTGWAETKTVTMMFDAVQQNNDELYKEFALKYMQAHPDVEIIVRYGPREVTDLLGLFLQFFEVKVRKSISMALTSFGPENLKNTWWICMNMGHANTRKTIFRQLLKTILLMGD